VTTPRVPDNKANNFPEMKNFAEIAYREDRQSAEDYENMIFHFSKIVREEWAKSQQEQEDEDDKSTKKE
jgi:hypothetical protein